jgi:hypothetical protein
MIKEEYEFYATVNNNSPVLSVTSNNSTYNQYDNNFLAQTLEEQIIQFKTLNDIGSYFEDDEMKKKESYFDENQIVKLVIDNS